MGFFKCIFFGKPGYLYVIRENFPSSEGLCSINRIFGYGHGGRHVGRHVGMVSSYGFLVGVLVKIFKCRVECRKCSGNRLNRHLYFSF